MPLATFPARSANTPEAHARGRSERARSLAAEGFDFQVIGTRVLRCLTLRSTGRATAFVARASFHSGPAAARCRTPVSFTLGITGKIMFPTILILLTAVAAFPSGAPCRPY
jgi:hypothetical protein